MTKAAAASSNYDYKDEKYKSPAGILLHSRTVVEKDGFVSTGLLTYAEGDIIEVEIPEYKVFNLGDSVKITVYSPGGIYTFLSSVVAKHQGALIIINPPLNQNRFVEKRESPRVRVNQKGSLHAVSWLHLDEKQKLTDTIGLTVQNISVSGIGFVLSDEGFDLGSASVIEAELDLGFKLPIVAEIIRRESLFEGYYYGARYVDMEIERVTSIRAFVLKMQVESYFKEKELRELKRAFK
ncbi:PilZ domain-containing protein [Paenibacillus sp. LMG 31456]|uniref:PilZ domain-containing protein n=1 Tax=Paenibacillus foliorum TaxID=2654974 RepID=A0A972GQE9_9BACL|nr:PilZ domain-containing protein [Paenibacillus foliorum]NOU95006.1 PilZ domain-containing protein [Paenibacillus foliorum]